MSSLFQSDLVNHLAQSYLITFWSLMAIFFYIIPKSHIYIICLRWDIANILLRHFQFVLKQEWPVIIWLMIWLLCAHKHPCYGLCLINGTASSTRKGFIYLSQLHICAQQWKGYKCILRCLNDLNVYIPRWARYDVTTLESKYPNNAQHILIARFMVCHLLP